MRLSFELPLFKCSEKMKPHLQKVFSGEYDIMIQFGYSPVILDLGANVGAFSIWAAHRWPGAQIHAYEPHPENVKQYKENLDCFPNIFLSEVGVGTPGLRPLFNGKNNEGEHSFYHMLNNPNPTGQHIAVIDPLLLPEADILKMDIEGCEREVLPVLLGAGRKFKAILFEFHSEDIRRECDELLEDYILVSSELATPGRGTVKYLHREFLGE